MLLVLEIAKGMTGHFKSLNIKARDLRKVIVYRYSKPWSTMHKFFNLNHNIDHIIIVVEALS